ncbi:very-long-chain enoyl-CoA reductase [Marchantia polymorpha subsp. ruderalis]|uniref:3-oxo-5-alpha-steroid 4-dehydrogenase C-terminal domain-containing protein n=2 Tax=Marchantia polymorpha TaxID=3197 RepID=A0AAF6ARH1_MARPO|nr:hypothetical protein MARPO_0001s0158 [Marchantia polymorpha]QKE45398.1 enoyl-CoA reductase [Marchantia polymorpha]BBM99041.1 hypothetical protein Mp_1g18200 [Marchantia polymorpha subsp. ruderalis]|eukprot:PTQ50116.1 hypothetical protein MARPO_0001s0158 [Marchantia polymorpha]
MRLDILSRSGREVVKGGVELQDDATVDDLKKEIYKSVRKFYPARQRLTLPLESGQVRPTVLESGKKLKEYIEGNHAKVLFKDLGPQVGYSTLFFFEYIGPLLLYPIFYFYPAIYTYFGLPLRKEVHQAQTWALYAWSFHYSKRILETFFVHRFSHATSPISNVYRNCAYYWSFGAFIAYFVNHPLYTPVGEKQVMFGFALSVVAQMANFYTHIILKNLRAPDGKGGYQIPKGFLFNYITCANYTTEIYQWIGFNIATQTVAGYSFLAIAGLIMTMWALGKHKRLRRTFDGKEGRAKYPRRWVIFPPFL